MSTLIQWTDVTDNIIVAAGGGWWCRRISPGCDNCYACALNQSSYFGGNHLDYTGDPPQLYLRREILASWKRQTKAKKHFVASMTDVAGEWIPREWVFDYLDAMAAAPKQTFQVLTKRMAVLTQHVLAWLAARGRARVPDNIWLGFSAETQEFFDQRATHALKLREVCRVLWCSAEPLLGPVMPRLCRRDHDNDGNCDIHPNGCPRLDWIVFGGESGKKARQCNIDAIREGVKLCRKLGITPFVKQVGAKPVYTAAGIEFESEDGCENVRRMMGDPSRWIPWNSPHNAAPKITHKKGGEMAEWPEDLRVREFPKAA